MDSGTAASGLFLGPIVAHFYDDRWWKEEPGYVLLGQHTYQGRLEVNLMPTPGWLCPC